MTSVEDMNFYGEWYAQLLTARDFVLQQVECYTALCMHNDEDSGIEHCKSRIKSAESMKRKLKLKELLITAESAITLVTDAVGVRIVCKFVSDVYRVGAWLKAQNQWEFIEQKDYIAHPKPNGYRSYHLIFLVHGVQSGAVFVEVQIRTMAQDCWASLEHQIKYKRNISNEKLIVSELRRCASEIAATDFSLQTIRELIDISV